MGCNMCVVEKAEEHFKASNGLRHGVIGRRSPHSSPPAALGREQCKAGQEQSVEAHRSPRDPLVIQVLRRSPRCKGVSSGQDLQLVDNSTQTEISFEHIMALRKEPSQLLPVVQLEPYALSDLPPLGNEFYDPNDYLDSGHHEVDRTEELEYERVELYKQSHTEKLGLTVCYRTDDEADTGIYVGEINPNGIAAKDGRIRAGDRIVQINGVEVQNREEAVAILTREDSTNISLLLARPELELDEGWMEDSNEAVNMSTREEGIEGTIQIGKASPAQQRVGAEAPGVTAGDRGEALGNSQDLDSGVGRTDDSARNDESSEHDLLADEPAPATPGSARRYPPSPGPDPSVCRRLGADSPAGGECPLPEVPGLTEAESDRYRELLELKWRLENAGGRLGRPLGWVPHGQRRGGMASALQEEMGHLEFKHRNVLRAQKMRQLRARCMAAWLATEGGAVEPPAPGAGGDPLRHSLCDITELPERPDRDPAPTTSSTSAYNTGESCRSTPPLGEAPLPTGPAPPGFRSLPREARRHPEEQRARRCQSRGTCRAGATDAVRLRGFTQLEQPQLRLDFPPAGAHGAGQPEARAEWKARGRAEGTRSAAKRPVRDRLLKARALKIREERAGMTTDDDTASEMKMGRYWSKEERKQHLARAREHRRRRELMLQSRLDSLREQQGTEGARSGTELSIIALSHKKSLRKRSRKILDNWITIQEMLAYGTRAPDGRRVYNPLLSVTTV